MTRRRFSRPAVKVRRTQTSKKAPVRAKLPKSECRREFDVLCTLWVQYAQEGQEGRQEVEEALTARLGRFHLPPGGLLARIARLD
jgi:hypothetical protein